MISMDGSHACATADFSGMRRRQARIFQFAALCRPYRIGMETNVQKAMEAEMPAPESGLPWANPMSPYTLIFVERLAEKST